MMKELLIFIRRKNYPISFGGIVVFTKCSAVIHFFSISVTGIKYKTLLTLIKLNTNNINKHIKRNIKTLNCRTIQIWT